MEFRARFSRPEQEKQLENGVPLSARFDVPTLSLGSPSEGDVNQPSR